MIATRIQNKLYVFALLRDENKCKFSKEIFSKKYSKIHYIVPIDRIGTMYQELLENTNSICKEVNEISKMSHSKTKIFVHLICQKRRIDEFDNVVNMITSKCKGVKIIIEPFMYINGFTNISVRVDKQISYKSLFVNPYDLFMVDLAINSDHGDWRDTMTKFRMINPVYDKCRMDPAWLNAVIATRTVWYFGDEGIRVYPLYLDESCEFFNIKDLPEMVGLKDYIGSTNY